MDIIRFTTYPYYYYLLLGTTTTTTTTTYVKKKFLEARESSMNFPLGVLNLGTKKIPNTDVKP